MKIRNTKRQQGFTLIEAMVALLVVSLGMLGIVGFQLALSLNSDVAKQRTEATRLAQEKVEQLRTFDSLTSYASNLVSGSETITATAAGSNTSFTRTWSVSTISGASTPETGRNILVTVEWTDRANSTQRVQLLSAISATDPSMNGSLFFPLPEGTILRRPKNRSLDIPIPAISIPGSDKSYIPWTGTSGGYLVFSDTSGDIVQKCTSTPTLENLSTCATFNGYLLSGYITGRPPTGHGTSIVYNVTQISFSSTQYISGSPECSVGHALDQTTGAEIANTLFYVCLITPTDHDSNPATPPVWTGRTDLAGATSTSLSGTYTCRFSTDANTTNNDNHPAVYSLVDHSLDNQNFYLDTTACANTSASRVAHKTNT
jgi:prepilin-type N-terminal cleavage/methylation domain